MSRYDTEFELTNTNNSHVQMLDLIGHGKVVLDAGCSTGYLARALVDHGCKVSGVEFEREAAEAARPVLERLVIGDLEALDLAAEFGKQTFDVVVFGDVLEHLRDPVPTLRQARALLRPGGSVVVSIPNIGHGAVRLTLLKGEWDYQTRGLLDETHLRFFTRKSLTELLQRAGLIAVDFRRTTTGLFETELPVKQEDFPPELVDQILDDADATTYQFVVRAVPDDAEHAIGELNRREDEHRIRIHKLERQLDRVRRERDALSERADAEAAHTRGLEHRLDDLADELGSLQRTKTMRLTRLPRAIYARLRRLA